jgi:hypothetical protein
LAGPALNSQLREEILRRYAGSGTVRYGIARDLFIEHVAGVVTRYGTNFSDSEKLTLLASLHIDDL